MKVLFFASAFCDPCIHARAVLDAVGTAVPQLTIAELDIVVDVDVAEKAGITTTPTIVVLNASDEEVFRSTGVPTISQLLSALTLAL